MRIFVTFTFLFSVGAMIGWWIEFFFRKFFSSGNPEHKWVNPGFCLGPWLPLYGFGLLGLYIISTTASFYFKENTLFNLFIIFIVMAIAMTIIEFIAGEFSIRVLHVMLWDYSDCWGNIDNVICPLFTFFWGLLGIIYYIFMNPYITGLVQWLMANQLFSFFTGIFYGIFIIDVIYSANLINKLKNIANENKIIIEIEQLKLDMANRKKILTKKVHFFIPNLEIENIAEHLAYYRTLRAERIKQIANNYKINKK